MVNAHPASPAVCGAASATDSATEKRICIVTENRGFGGVEVHTVGLIDRLLREGYAVELVCCRHQLLDQAAQSPGWRAGVRLIHADLTMGYDFDFRLRAPEWVSFLKQIEARILLFPKINNGQGSIGFLRACRDHFDHVYFIEHLEEVLPPRDVRKILGFIPAGLGLWWYRRRIAKAIQPRFADHTVAVSDAVKRGLVALGARQEKITTVRNGVNWNSLARDAERAKLARDAYRIPHQSFVFGMLARLRPEKGIDIALRAVQELQKRTSRDFVLVIAGQGSERDALEKLARDLGVADRVRFLGFVARPAEMLSAYDSIVFSSRLEGLPLGLLEGMAAGCIPIVTRISGMPEAVSDPSLGWVTAPESSSELARAMEALLNLDSVALQEMRRRVVEHIQTRFDVDESHSQIIRALHL